MTLWRVQRPPRLTDPGPCPRRVALRSASWRPLGPHTAVTSASIIAASLQPGAHGQSQRPVRYLAGVDPGGPPRRSPIHLILDNLSANETPSIRACAARNKVELCFTLTSASWANRIKAQFRPLRKLVMGASNQSQPHRADLPLQAYLRRRATTPAPSYTNAEKRPGSEANANKPGPTPRGINR